MKKFTQTLMIIRETDSQNFSFYDVNEQKCNLFYKN